MTKAIASTRQRVKTSRRDPSAQRRKRIDTACKMLRSVTTDTAALTPLDAHEIGLVAAMLDVLEGNASTIETFEAIGQLLVADLDGAAKKLYAVGKIADM